MTMIQPPPAPDLPSRLARIRAALDEAGLPPNYDLEESSYFGSSSSVTMHWHSFFTGKAQLSMLASTYYRALFLSGEAKVCWDCFRIETGNGCGPQGQHVICRDAGHPIEWLPGRDDWRATEDAEQVQEPVDHFGIAPHLTSVTAPEPRFH